MQISELLKIRKKGENVGFVVPLLEEQVLLDSIIDNRERRRDVFHPSEICRSDFCPRAWVLCQRDISLYDKIKINAQQQLRFDIGKLLHKYIQEKLGNTGVLFGVWKCLRMCDGENCFYMGFKPKGICKKELWEYREATLFDDDLNIVGNVDGIIVPDKTKKWTLEFKSMNTDSFSTLAQPVSQDKEQACWYLDIISRKGFQEWNNFYEKDDGSDMYKDAKEVIDMPFNGAVVLYMNKNTQAFREYYSAKSDLAVKEFAVEKDKSLSEVIEGKKKILSDTVVHLKKDTLPERLYQCDSSTARRAKRCIAVQPCFR